MGVAPITFDNHSVYERIEHYAEYHDGREKLVNIEYKYDKELFSIIKIYKDGFISMEKILHDDNLYKCIVNLWNKNYNLPYNQNMECPDYAIECPINIIHNWAAFLEPKPKPFRLPIEIHKPK